MKYNFLLSLAGSLALAGLTMPAAAQDLPVAPSVERPQEAQFNGTNGISLPAAESLNITDVSTIEFWVRAGWDELPQYNPTILSVVGKEGPRYAIVMLADKQAIGLMSGDEWDYAEYDFNDGQLHHVAFINQGDLSDVYIDGVLQDSITQPFADIPAIAFHIGSLNGNVGAFQGTLAEIRLWDTALDPDDLQPFSTLHILGNEGRKHPDIESLVGVSDFANGRRNFALANNELTLDEITELAKSVADGEDNDVLLDEDVVIEPGTPDDPLTPQELAEFDEPLDEDE